MDWLSFGFWADFWLNHALWLMFASALLSATVLPGNSEAVFVALIVPKLASGNGFGEDIIGLILVATIGNGLGSLTTYAVGRWLPAWKPKQHRIEAAQELLRRYGLVALLLSWLPVVGDLICALAGWLRLDLARCSLFIFLGKFIRYVALLFLSAPFLL